MTIYCNAGDIARVTMPDGSIYDYTDTPIDIKTNTGYANGVIYVVIKWHAYTDQPQIVNGIRFDCNDKVSSYVTYIESDNGFQVVFTDGTHRYLQGTNYQPFLSLDNYQFYNNGNLVFDNTPGNEVDIPLVVTLTVTGFSGNQLFSGNFNNKNYSVNCIKQGCPDGTLDCGDCCLTCDSVFNTVSSIRKLLSGIK